MFCTLFNLAHVLKFYEDDVIIVTSRVHTTVSQCSICPRVFFTTIASYQKNEQVQQCNCLNVKHQRFILQHIPYKCI